MLKLKIPPLLRRNNTRGFDGEEPEEGAEEYEEDYSSRQRDSMEQNFKRINFSTFKAFGLKIFSFRDGTQARYKIGKNPPSIIWTEIRSLPQDAAIELWRDGKKATVRLLRNGSAVDYCEINLP